MEKITNTFLTLGLIIHEDILKFIWNQGLSIGSSSENFDSSSSLKYISAPSPPDLGRIATPPLPDYRRCGDRCRISPPIRTNLSRQRCCSRLARLWHPKMKTTPIAANKKIRNFYVMFCIALFIQKILNFCDEQTVLSNGHFKFFLK